MTKVAEILGLDAAAAEPMVAVVRCNGTCANRPHVNQYDGAKSCAIAASLYGGETGCSFGCLGCGDCVSACQFGAIRMNPETGLPEVDESKIFRIYVSALTTLNLDDHNRIRTTDIRILRRLVRDYGAGLDAAALILDLSQEVRRLKAQLRALGLEDK